MKKNTDELQSKRKTLKALLGGTGVIAGASAVPDKWSKPVISSVLLPAHAQATGAGTRGECVPLEFSVEVGAEPATDEISVLLDSEGTILTSTDGTEGGASVNVEYGSETGPQQEEFASTVSALVAGTTFDLEDDFSDLVDIVEVDVSFEYCGEDTTVPWSGSPP